MLLFFQGKPKYNPQVTGSTALYCVLHFLLFEVTFLFITFIYHFSPHLSRFALLYFRPCGANHFFCWQDGNYTFSKSSCVRSFFRTLISS